MAFANAVAVSVYHSSSAVWFHRVACVASFTHAGSHLRAVHGFLSPPVVSCDAYALFGGAVRDAAISGVRDAFKHCCFAGVRTTAFTDAFALSFLLLRLYGFATTIPPVDVTCTRCLVQRVPCLQRSLPFGICGTCTFPATLRHCLRCTRIGRLRFVLRLVATPRCLFRYALLFTVVRLYRLFVPYANAGCGRGLRLHFRPAFQQTWRVRLCVRHSHAWFVLPLRAGLYTRLPFRGLRFWFCSVLTSYVLV